jgi:HEAT repeat protein
LENLAQLRRTIRNTRGLGEAEVADPFAGGWSLIKPAVTAGIKDSDPAVRLATTEALETLGDAIEARALLREATTDKDLFVRWSAARALGQSAPFTPDPVGNEPDVAALAKLVTDPDIDVRTAAINAIAKFGRTGKSQASTMLAAVNRGDVEPRVAAIKSLGAIESDAAATVPELTKALQHTDLRVRRAAASGLVRFGPDAKAALPELRKAVIDADPELRLAAAEAILAIEIRKPREL